MSTKTKLEQAVKTGRPVTGANFGNRRQRKAYRKTLRSTIANKIIDRNLDREDKQKYYRTLRDVKIRRRQLVNEFRILVESLEVLQREVNRVHDRVPNANHAVIDSAWRVIGQAVRRAEETAAEFEAFSRRRVLHYRRAV